MKAKADKQKFLKSEQIRKQNRKLAREKRAKDQAKEKFRLEILKQIVDKGEVRNPSANFDLLDLHGNQESKQNLTTYGGQFQQLYYVVAAIMELYENEI